MHVAEKEDVSGLQGSFHHEFSVVVNRIELARRSYPLSVQILAD
jgi:hypothetical protein